METPMHQLLDLRPVGCLVVGYLSNCCEVVSKFYSDVSRLAVLNEEGVDTCVVSIEICRYEIIYVKRQLGALGVRATRPVII